MIFATIYYLSELFQPTLVSYFDANYTLILNKLLQTHFINFGLLIT